MVLDDATTKKMSYKLSHCLMILAFFINCWKRSTTQLSSTDAAVASSPLPRHPDAERIKSAFLSMFGFNDVPNNNPNSVVPDAIRQLYQIQVDYDLDTASIPLPGLNTQSANTVRSFTHIESPIDDRFKSPNKFRLKFDTTTIPINERLQVAELKLTRNRHKMNTNNYRYQRILINDILKPGRKGHHGPMTRLIDSQLIDVRKNDTLSLDMTPAVQRWLADPSTNYGVLIKIYTVVGDVVMANKENNHHHRRPPIETVRLRRNNDNYHTSDDDNNNWMVKQPLLLVYTDDGRNKQRTGADMVKIRSKRAIRRNHRKGDQRDPCKKRPMFVNFRDVGWSDWIVAPLGYDAFFCDGECEYPMAEHMNTTNHAIVQSLMNSARPYDVPKPCCVPTQLSSMSMLYVDSQNNVILKNYKEMVVNGCGCR